MSFDKIFEQRLQDLSRDADLFYQLITHFPYPVQIYSADGTMIMMNEACKAEFNISDESAIIGKYNLLKDPTLADKEVYHTIQAAFSGEVVQTHEFLVPLHLLKKMNGLPSADMEALYQDITSIPIKDNGNIIFIVNILITQRKLHSRTEVEAAKAYINAHWREEFKTADVAKAVCLSTAYFSRLFKAYTGITPFEYYRNVKIDKLKDKLLDLNCSVEKAFAECGMHYHSRYAKLFKEKTGLTFSEYKKSVSK
ncbi:MAG: helix-turn-helix transcriptional regulator [Syntrophomonadaceae bacterium]|nr:helix-turn-helix transcriptional regulator [Syntrophomonadaceae bacterium]